MTKNVLLAICALVVSACSINQSIEPAELSNGSELCIIENPNVRDGFLTEFESVLSSKNIPFKIVNRHSVPEGCEWTATYVARWSWDLTIYMSYAEIKVFHNGVLDGEAKYDATRGGANMNKFIDAEPKIRELVNKLMQYQSASLFFHFFG